MSNEWFYTGAAYVNNDIYIKGYYQDGRPILGKKVYKPYGFIKGAGEYKMFDGSSMLRKKEFETSEEMEEFSKKTECYGINIEKKFVSRLESIYVWLSDTFREDVVFDVSHMGILDYDIETTSLSPETGEILSISCSVLRNNKRVYKTFGIKFCSDERIHDYERCDDEYEMLKKFCQYVRSTNVDILTGWNIERFDTPYLCDRIENNYKKEWLKLLSPFDLMPKRKTKTVKNRKTGQDETFACWEIEGLSQLDSMKLYAKYDTYNGSMALNNIANRILGEKKLDYSEHSSLRKLYDEDYVKFLLYNQKDVDLVDKIIDKTRHIELAITISYLGKIRFEDSFSPIRVWDMLIHNYLLYERKVVIPRLGKRIDKKKEPKVRGGAVKDAKLGFAEYVITTDAESLYPSIIVSLNISPETFLRKVKDVDEEYLKKMNYGLSSNNCLFDNNKEGVLALLVASVFEKRKDYKNRMKEEKKRGGDEDLIKRLDIFQYAMKILINSAYGVFASVFFRYYNLDLAEAITLTGQSIIKTTNNNINDYLNEYLGTVDKDYIIFSDTDSSAFEMKDVIEKENPENIVDYLDNFYEDRIAPYLRNKLEISANSRNFKRNTINFKREKIITKMVVVAKKKYFGIVNDNEGYRYKEPEIFLTGVEIVRSSTPDCVKAPLLDCMNIVLNGTEWELQDYIMKFRKEYQKLSITDISFPRGTNSLHKYIDKDGFKDSTPIQVRAAILYNNLLQTMGLETEYDVVTDSDKIKYVYLIPENPLFQNVIGYKSSLPKEFGLDEYVDYNTMYKKTFLSPLRTILEAVGWEEERCDALF